MKHAQPLSLLLTLTAAAGLAMAQPAKKDTTDKDLLRGPDVTESGTSTNSGNKERPEINVKEQLEKQPMEMRELTGSLRILSSERVAAELRLTDEQQDKIKEITKQYREDLREFQQANIDEIRKLREAMRYEARERREQMQKEAEQRKNDGGSMQENARDEKPRQGQDESPSARKLRLLINNSPAAKNAMKRIEGTLSAAQMDAIREAVVKSRVRKESGDASARRERDSDGNGPRTTRRGMDSERPSRERRDRNQQRGTTSEDPIDD